MSRCARRLLLAPWVVLALAALSVPGQVAMAHTSAAAAVTGTRGAGQLITVTARSHSATTARLVAFRRARHRWVRVFGPWTARVGYNGIAAPGSKREGDGRTPSGSYRFGFFFGVLPDPGVAGTYRRVRRYDVWDDDPSSRLYNLWVDSRKHNPGSNPEPLDRRPVYDYAVVIDYNSARVPGLGSAIFLHVGTGGATAGCVSLPQRELVDLLRWLRPRRSPRIVIQVAARAGG